MGAGQVSYENNEAVFPHDIYSPALKIISKIHFSRRQIDIVACILGGRSVKKIASFLSLAPKTVENHIQNIKLKLSSNSRENIIDFIEASDKFTLVKKHYSNLLIQVAFELELKKISTLIKKQSPKCLIFWHKQQNKEALMCQVEKHLNLSGINVVNEFWEKDKYNADITNEAQFPLVDYIIYSMSKKFIKQLKESKHEINVEASNLMHVAEKKLKAIIFLFSDNKDFTDDREKLVDFTCLDLEEQENYYFFIFAILKKLLPTIGIDENISNFKNQYAALHDYSFVQKELQKNETLKKEPVTSRFYELSKKNLGLKKIIIVLLGFLVCFSAFYTGREMQFSAIKSQQEARQERLNSSVQQMQKTNNSAMNLDKTSAAVANEKPIEQIHEWNLPYYMEHYTQRKDITNAIWEKLSTGAEKIKTVSLVGLHGLGGVGKTFLAINATHYPKHDYVFKGWFNAENEDMLRASYFELGEKLHLFTKKMSNKQKINIVKFWLEDKKNILLVYDNSPSMKMLDKYLPNKGHVIITSRNYKLPGAIEVDVMIEKEAICLLSKILPKRIKGIRYYNRDVKKLIKELGYLPLAISQAGAYMAWNMVTVPEYLLLYNTKKERLLLRKTMPPRDKHEPVYVTWNISIKEMQKHKHGDKAIRLLDFIAYCYPENIPKALLTQYLYGTVSSETKLEFNRVLGLLRKYSIIKLSSTTISIHRLVQSWLKSQHSQAKTFTILKKSSLAIESIYPLERIHALANSTIQEEEFIKGLLPHIESIFSKIQVFSKDVETVKLMLIMENSYTVLEYYHKGKQLIERILTTLEKNYNSNYMQTARILEVLGWSSYRLGDFAKSRDLLEKAFAVSVKHYGFEHEQTAKIVHKLGRALLRLGDYVEGKQLLERALAVSEKHYGTNHVETANNLYGLSWASYYLGDYATGKQLLKRALVIFESHYGSDYVGTARILFSLGDVFCHLGEYSEGRQLLEKALAINKKYYSPAHVETARILKPLGRVLLYLDEYAKGKLLLEKAAVIFENHYGPEHVETAKNLYELSWAYYHYGDYEKGKQLSEKALAIFKKYYGPNHVETANGLYNLSWAYYYLGNYKKGNQSSENALRIFEKYYGPAHAQTAKILFSLGSVLIHLGEYAKGKQLLERALAIFEKHYYSGHIETARILFSLGSTSLYLGDYEKGKQLSEKALAIFEKHYGPEHVKTARILNCLGCGFLQLGDYARGKQLSEKALAIFEKHYGPDHVETAKILNSIGCSLLQSGDYAKGKQLLEKALAIFERHYGPNHAQTARTLNSLGSAFLHLGDYAKGKQLLEQALTIVLKSHGKKHRYTAVILANIGDACRVLNKVADSERILKKALSFLEEFYGSNDIRVAKVRANLGLLYGDLGNNIRKKEYLTKALTVFNNHLHSEHKNIKRLLRELREINNVSSENIKNKLPKTLGYYITGRGDINADKIPVGF